MVFESRSLTGLCGRASAGCPGKDAAVTIRRRVGMGLHERPSGLVVETAQKFRNVLFVIQTGNEIRGSGLTVRKSSEPNALMAEELLLPAVEKGEPNPILFTDPEGSFSFAEIIAQHAEDEWKAELPVWSDEVWDDGVCMAA